MLLLTGVGATAAEAPEIVRHSQNQTRLQKMHPAMRPKVRAILADLDSHGLKPVIHADVWRSPARQAQLVRAGRSTVRYSFHTVTGRNGQPESLAADVVGFYQGWNVSPEFWRKLASSARAHNLETGINWRFYDPAHVQPKSSTITLAQAKAGKRPQFGKDGR